MKWLWNVYLQIKSWNFHGTANQHHENLFRTRCLVTGVSVESVAHLTKKNLYDIFLLPEVWIKKSQNRKISSAGNFSFFLTFINTKSTKKIWLLCSGSNIFLWSVRPCMYDGTFFVIYISIDTRQTERQFLSSEYYSRRKAKKCLALYYLYGILHAM